MTLTEFQKALRAIFDRQLAHARTADREIDEVMARAKRAFDAEPELYLAVVQAEAARAERITAVRQGRAAQEEDGE